jgi:DNA-binding MarR family transcriptional regulator
MTKPNGTRIANDFGHYPSSLMVKPIAKPYVGQALATFPTTSELQMRGTSNAQGNRDQVALIRDTVVELVRHKGKDLSIRQLAVFLTCYLHDRDHTVRGLAAELQVSKPAITRVLDRLAAEGLARRKTDPRDRRSVLVERTTRGMGFLRELQTITVAAARATGANRLQDSFPVDRKPSPSRQQARPSPSPVRNRAAR